MPDEIAVLKRKVERDGEYRVAFLTVVSVVESTRGEHPAEALKRLRGIIAQEHDRVTANADRLEREGEG